jgi:Ca2+/Na+ antiporter
MYMEELALPLFAFYLIVFCNFTKELLGCRLQHALDKNIFAKHFIGFMLLFLLVIMVDPKNMEKNLLSNLGFTILIYVLFMITTKLNLYVMLIVLLLLLVCYILATIAKKKREEKKDDEYKNLKIVEQTLFIIMAIISVVGLSLYFMEKYREYGNRFSIIKFILGVTSCRNYTPSAAKII